MLHKQHNMLAEWLRLTLYLFGNFIEKRDNIKIWGKLLQKQCSYWVVRGFCILEDCSADET